MPTARDDRAGVVLTFASPERCAGAIVSYCCAPGYSSAMECESHEIRHPIFGADRHVGQRGLSECLRAPSWKCALLSLLELRCFLCRLLQYVEPLSRYSDRGSCGFQRDGQPLRPLRSLHRQRAGYRLPACRDSFAPTSEPRRYCQHKNTSIRNTQVRIQSIDA